MRKWMAVLMCLMILSGCALAEETPAETRTATVEIEGMTEEITETLHMGGGYGIWYPADMLTVSRRYGHTVFVPTGEEGETSETYLMIVEDEIAPEMDEAYLQEAVGGYGPEAAISEAEWKTLESGLTIGSVEAQEGGVVWRFYLIREGEKALAMTASFPLEAAEGFGARFDRMAGTVEFESVPLDGRYEGEGFEIQYPSLYLEPGVVSAHEGFLPVGSGGESEVYLLIVESDVSGENADSLLGEAVAGYEGYHAVSEIQEKALDNGLTVKSVEVEQEGMIHRYYLVTGGEKVYCLTASFPVMSETDYGSLFEKMTDTMELTGGAE